MLIFARNEGESIVLTLPDGRRITVTMVEKRDGRPSVRLGIVAPPDVVVHRNEIQEMVDAGTHFKRKLKPPIVPSVKIGERLPGET